MIVVNHRVNLSSTLLSCDKSQGVEIDVRSDINGLYLSHDPFEKGERLDDWLRSYSHAFLIVNVKEDGLEDQVLEELSKAKVTDFFFLDQASPTIIRRGNSAKKDSALRYSEFESLETVKLMSDFASWVWLDSFGSRKLQAELLQEFRNLGLRTCLVSPELHDVSRAVEIHDLILSCLQLELKLDAVCTKFPAAWSALT